MDRAVTEGVTEIVRGILRRKGVVGPLDTLRLLRDGHLDSMDVVNLVAQCEQRFHVRFAPEDFDEAVMDSFSEICQRVETRLAR